jgi:hypothetical protein
MFLNWELEFGFLNWELEFGFLDWEFGGRKGAGTVLPSRTLAAIAVASKTPFLVGLWGGRFRRGCNAIGSRLQPFLLQNGRGLLLGGTRELPGC